MDDEVPEGIDYSRFGYTATYRLVGYPSVFLTVTRAGDGWTWKVWDWRGEVLREFHERVMAHLYAIEKLIEYRDVIGRALGDARANLRAVGYDRSA